MDIIIRNLDASAGAKLTEMAKEKGISREAYLRTYLETLSLLDDLYNLDMKYNSLVNHLADVIQNNTEELKQIKSILEKIK